MAHIECECLLESVMTVEAKDQTASAMSGQELAHAKASFQSRNIFCQIRQRFWLNIIAAIPTEIAIAQVLVYVLNLLEAQSERIQNQVGGKPLHPIAYPDLCIRLMRLK